MSNSIRSGKPEKNNPFYNTVSNGGYSRCIQGKPTIDGLNVLCNCVGFACGFFNEIIGEMKYPYLNCNAENFIERAKKMYPELQVVEEPTEGGIMVWEGKGSLAGHAACVVKVNSSTQVYTAESGYNSFSFANYTRNKGNGNYGLNESKYKYLGCIVNPKIGEYRSYQDIPEPPKDNIPVEPEQKGMNRDLLLTLTKRTIRGDFGNNPKRKETLGKYYEEVQDQVNKNIKNGTTRWDNIKLY